MILNPFIYQSGGGGSGPILLVTVTGAMATSVTATKSGVTKALAYDSTLGKWWAALPSTGTWTVTAYNGVISSSSTTVSASNIALYETSLQLNRLPAGYTELEYIQMSGTQYIDTGINAQDYYNVKSKINSSQNSGLYGGENGANKNLIYFFPNKTDILIYGPTTTYVTADTTCVANTTYTIEVDFLPSHSVKLNGNTISGTENAGLSDIGPNQNITLFADKASGAMNYYMTGKCWYLTMFDPSDASEVANFIPAKNSSNVVGMYDIVRNGFYTNAGTGVFTAGPVV